MSGWRRLRWEKENEEDRVQSGWIQWIVGVQGGKTIPASVVAGMVVRGVVPVMA
jgi:hypothetical protein